ncbi:NUDIX domain-containing protein [Streptomyces sp. NPDC037389]|uniref:NUDIX hydrolase n=1 Tax=Streptomyces sp. NPDC037389 TaxID=3155369 RepID=UPI0033DC94CF
MPRDGAVPGLVLRSSVRSAVNQGGLLSPALTVIGAHLLFERDDRVLLGRRSPRSAFAPDTWHLPAGHVEGGESARRCAARESEEELGIAVREEDLQLVHVVHLLDSPGDRVPRMQMFFRVGLWSGEPRLREPDRCSAWKWWPRLALPDPMVGYARVALEAIASGWPFTDMGWPQSDLEGRRA